MHRTSFLLAVVVILALPLGAQPVFEVTPFLGYSFGSSFDEIGYDNGVIDSVDVADSETYGLIFNAGTDRGGFEFTWSHQGSELEVDGVVGASEDPTFDFSSDNFQFGGIYYFGQNSKTRPYVNGGLGFAMLDLGDSESDERFSWSIGGGIRHDFNDRIGVRLQARWVPTYINSDDAYVVCDPWFCYTVADDNYLYQTEIAAGVVIKLGR